MKKGTRTIFVFGSNKAGRHGKGAALEAHLKWGAIYGLGWAMQGDSYAIPTKGYALETLPLQEIKKYVDGFIKFAQSQSELRFLVTRIGCGLAGYTDYQIAPMFQKAPQNCILPRTWREILKNNTIDED